MKTAKTLRDLNPFIGLCKAGKLFEVQKWIDDGKASALRPGPKDQDFYVGLNKAFCGELVSQDMSDEPATGILEQIKLNIKFKVQNESDVLIKKH